jgi:outer membrane protein OmpA-like peptidoglycan-associated protein
MDRKKLQTLSIVLTLTLLFTTCVFLAVQNIALANECRIITIKGGGKSGVSTSLGSIISADPSTIYVTTGTCVVWVNHAHATEVRVTFKDGKACADVTESPRGFSMDEEQCYVTNYLPLGGTSSLIFRDEGEYEYILEHGREQTATGKIIVKKAPMAEGVAAEEDLVDSDGDGVPDSVDLCPGTPKGATVNKKGCWALKGMLLFDFDSSTIKPEAYPLLDEVAVILEKNPEIKGEIRGHADSTGHDEYNWKLSEKRAKAVDKYLEDKGIDSSRWTIKGYGSSQPIESNETEEGRQANRRVELVRIQ